jgi:hypothetical protein
VGLVAAGRIVVLDGHRGPLARRQVKNSRLLDRDPEPARRLLLVGQAVRSAAGSPGVRVRPMAEVAQPLRVRRRELLFVPQGREVVCGKQLDHLVLAVGKRLLRPAGHVEVLRGPVALR